MFLQPVWNWIIGESQLWAREVGAWCSLGSIHKAPGAHIPLPAFRGWFSTHSDTPGFRPSARMQAFSICCCHWPANPPLAFPSHPKGSFNCLGHFLSLFNFLKGILYLISLSSSFTKVTKLTSSCSRKCRKRESERMLWIAWEHWSIHPCTVFLTFVPSQSTRHLSLVTRLCVSWLTAKKSGWCLWTCK